MGAPVLVPRTVGSPRSWLGAADTRWCRHSVVEVFSSAADVTRLGVGSSPYLGDTSSTGLLVPALATTGPLNRYLFRLCGVSIPMGSAIRVRGLRTLSTLRATFYDDNQNLQYAMEKEITSPLWSFPDGNISWHLRWQKLQETQDYDAAGVPGPAALDSRLLLGIGPDPNYNAPAAGRPPGRAVPALGSWRDNRFPWSVTDWSLDVLLQEPGDLVLYASVYQTDPDTRFVPPPVADPGSLRPEDRFLQAYPDAIYGRVAGALSVEIFPEK